MAKARIAADAVRAACRRRRDGSHVSAVVIVPAFHSAPATDAPQIAAPTTRNSAAVSRKLSSPPPPHHEAMRAGWVRSRASATGSRLVR